MLPKEKPIVSSEKSIALIGLIIVAILFIGITFQFKEYSSVALLVFWLSVIGLGLSLFYFLTRKNFEFYQNYFTVNKTKTINYNEINGIKTSVQAYGSIGMPLSSGRVTSQNEIIYITLKDGTSLKISNFDYDNFKLIRKWLLQLEPIG